MPNTLTQGFKNPRLLIHTASHEALSNLVALTPEEAVAAKESKSYPDWLHNLDIYTTTHVFVAVSWDDAAEVLLAHSVAHNESVPNQIGYLYAELTITDPDVRPQLNAEFEKLAHEMLSVISSLTILKQKKPEMETLPINDLVAIEVVQDSYTSATDVLRYWSYADFNFIAQHKKYNLGLPQSAAERAAAAEASSFSEWLTLCGISSETHYVYPIYMLDHSGLIISKSPFGCKWDSGQIGYMYVSKEGSKGCKPPEYANPDQLQDFCQGVSDQDERNSAMWAAWFMQQAIAQYNAVLSGDIYNFKITVNHDASRVAYSGWRCSITGPDLESTVMTEIEEAAEEAAPTTGWSALDIKTALLEKWEKVKHENSFQV